ncbi:hypothetical protein M0804_009675 [Polistes exclamans]|nr:hypothetical protein M0804_009675 [Polistes exclamans]
MNPICSVALHKIYVSFMGNKSIEDTADFITEHFAFEEVRIAMIEYVFEKLRTNRNDFERILFTSALHSRETILEILKAIVEKYPSWTIRRYMDAIKVDEFTLHEYLIEIDFPE